MQITSKSLAYILVAPISRCASILLAISLSASAKSPFSLIYSSSQCNTLPKNIQPYCLEQKGRKAPFEFGVFENSEKCSFLTHESLIIECRDSIKSAIFYYSQSYQIHAKEGETFREGSELKRLRKIGWIAGLPLDTCRAIELSEKLRTRLSERFSESCKEESDSLMIRRKKTLKSILLVATAISAIYTVYIYAQFMTILRS